MFLVRRVVLGLLLIGLSLLLIWAFDIKIEPDNKFSAGIAAIPGIVGAWLVWSPVRYVLWGEGEEEG